MNKKLSLEHMKCPLCHERIRKTNFSLPHTRVFGRRTFWSCRNHLYGKFSGKLFFKEERGKLFYFDLKGIPIEDLEHCELKMRIIYPEDAWIFDKEK